MDYKELKKKNQSELHKILAEQRDKLRDLRFKDANKQLKNVREIRKVRTLIARALTLLNNKKTTDAPVKALHANGASPAKALRADGAGGQQTTEKE